MKTITKITGLLILLASFNFANAAIIVAVTPVQPGVESSTEIGFTINESANDPAPAIVGGAPNVVIIISLTNLELRGAPTDITGLLSYFRAEPPEGGAITLTQIAEIPAGFGGIPLVVGIPVNRTNTGNVGFSVAIRTRAPETLVLDPATDPLEGFRQIDGGGTASPNYSIGMSIGNAGNSLGTSESKELPLNIIVTETASADNTGPVVVALAKDSRLALATGCTPANWTKSDNSVAYLFTYANADGSNTFAPDPTKTDSTIVCPVTVTRPTTQSGKLQLNAVLRHGSGDTSTSNDVSSIEVTYN